MPETVVNVIYEYDVPPKIRWVPISFKKFYQMYSEELSIMDWDFKTNTWASDKTWYNSKLVGQDDRRVLAVTIPQPNMIAIYSKLSSDDIRSPYELVLYRFDTTNSYPLHRFGEKLNNIMNPILQLNLPQGIQRIAAMVHMETRNALVVGDDEGKIFQYQINNYQWTSLGLTDKQLQQIVYEPNTNCLMSTQASCDRRLNKQLQYNFNTKEWQPKTPWIHATQKFGLCSFGGKIYKIGGQKQAEDPSFALTVQDGVWHLNRSDASDLCERYCPVSDCWEIIRNMPTARFWPQVIVLDDQLVVLGGIFMRDHQSTITATVESFSAWTNLWTRLTNIPVLASGIAVMV